MIIATFVITVGLIAVMSLIHRAVISTQISYSRLVGAYLAQEGIEIVRNIRDANWLLQRETPGTPWDNGLGTGDWEAGFSDFSLVAYQGRPIKINGGFYNYTSGVDTKFKRKITIQKPGANILAVAVEISWQERGISYATSLQENLYNWK